MTITMTEAAHKPWCEAHDHETDMCTRTLVEFADMGAELKEQRQLRPWENDGLELMHYVVSLVPDLDGAPFAERLDLPAHPDVIRRVMKMLGECADRLEAMA